MPGLGGYIDGAICGAPAKARGGIAQLFLSSEEERTVNAHHDTLSSFGTITFSRGVVRRAPCTPSLHLSRAWQVHDRRRQLRDHSPGAMLLSERVLSLAPPQGASRALDYAVVDLAFVNALSFLSNAPMLEREGVDPAQV